MNTVDVFNYVVVCFVQLVESVKETPTLVSFTISPSTAGIATLGKGPSEMLSCIRPNALRSRPLLSAAAAVELVTVISVHCPST